MGQRNVSIKNPFDVYQPIRRPNGTKVEDEIQTFAHTLIVIVEFTRFIQWTRFL